MRGMHHWARRVFAAAMMAAFGVLLSTNAQAQDFELHPGWIEGTVQIGSSTITYGSVSAYGCDAGGVCHSANSQLVVPPGGSTTATFRLTVEGGFTYSVSAYVSIPGMSVYLPSGSVAVAVGDTATLNRSFPDWVPGTAHGTVEVTGGTLTGGWVNANAYDSTTGISAYSGGSIAADGTYSYAVPPGQVNQYASVSIGSNSYSLPYRTFTMPYGGDVQVDYTLDIGLPGSITGTITVNGDFIDYFSINAYGPGSSRYAYIYGSDGSFRFDDLTPGNWTLYAYAYDNLPDGAYRAYAFPYMYTTVSPEQVSNVDFSLDPAFVDGTLTFGNYGAPNNSYISVYAQPTDSGACCPGAWFQKSFYSSALPSSLDYGLFLDPNRRWSVRSWSVNNSYYYDGYTSSYNNVSGYQANAPEFELDPDEHVTQDFTQFNFNTGTLTLRMRVAGGGLLASPYVNGNGNRYDAGGNYLYSTYGYGYGQVESTESGYVGIVKMTLAPGTYTFDAYAYVEGSWTSFGRFTATIEGGSDTEQDISAPTLTVNSPADTCAASVTVSGTVSDTSGVAYLKVNGVDVAVNPDGSWSTDVAIGSGANTIVVESADTEGNQITVTRTVSRLGCSSPPVADAGGPYMTTEGTAVTLSAAGSSDPDGDTLTFEWDLDNDGTFETTGDTVSFVRPDDFAGTVTLRVSDGEESSLDTADVVVANVAPTASLQASAMVTHTATLRFAGQPGNTVCLNVTQNGAMAGGGCATRQTGSPDEQLLQVNFTVDLLQPYSAALTFDTESKKSGATPVWLVLSDGSEKKVATFNTNKNDPSTYQQTLALPDFSGNFSAVGHSVTFSGAGSDPGADAVAFNWSFGDGGSASSSFAGPGAFSDSQTHTFSSPGTFNVDLNVSDDDGGTDSDQITVTIP